MNFMVQVSLMVAAVASCIAALAAVVSAIVSIVAAKRLADVHVKVSAVDDAFNRALPLLAEDMGHLQAENGRLGGHG